MVVQQLETRFRDMQDFEFAYERGRLFVLAARPGKRTAIAAVKIAVDLAEQGLIAQKEAIMRVNQEQVSEYLLPRLDPVDKQNARERGDLLCRGINASPGVAIGGIVFDSARAEALAQMGKSVILFRPEQAPNDYPWGVVSKRGSNSVWRSYQSRCIDSTSIWLALCSWVC